MRGKDPRSWAYWVVGFYVVPYYGLADPLLIGRLFGPVYGVFCWLLVYICLYLT